MRVLGLVLPILLVGCVERILTVKSEPAGATVYLDGERAGETPCDVRYVWYGTRILTLERSEYRSVTRTIDLNPPWYQIFPLDFITDVVIPVTITDRTEVQFLLEKEGVEPVDEAALQARAEELREKAHWADKAVEAWDWVQRLLH